MNGPRISPLFMLAPVLVGVAACSADSTTSGTPSVGGATSGGIGGSSQAAGGMTGVATGGVATGVGGGSSAVGGDSATSGGFSSGGAFGGSSALGGATAAGGARPAGGTTGSSGGNSGMLLGGSSSVGGGSWSVGGGSSSVGGSTAIEGSGGAPSAACTFSVSHSVSEVIPTVGIVEWSVDRAVTGAHIEFGLDTNYGMVAPVDLSEPAYRTLLLGMKGSHSYHFRVVADSDAQSCASSDYSLTTGGIPNEITRPDVTTPLPEQLSGGYLITGRWGDGNQGPSFILDADTDVVWWYAAPDDVMRTRFSMDGKWMWMRNTAQMDGTGLVRRVTLDGLQEQRFELPSTTHDLAVLPDGHLALIGHVPNSCDEILDFNPEDGSLVSLFNAVDAHGSTQCHLNFIGYHAADDSLTFSDWEQDCFVKISRQGELIWVLNGASSSFQGTSWTHQHALHMLDPNHIVLFSNGAPGQNSIVYEYTLDTTAWTANELWRYDGGYATGFGGDVQRLSNGNTMISYSSSGVMQEVNSAGQLVQEMAWPVGYAVAYLVKRDSLYGGPPPRL